MKNVFAWVLTIIFYVGISNPLNAQSVQSNGLTLDNPHLIKLNVTAIAFKTFSVQYEYALTHKIAVGLGLRHAPNASIPFKSIWENLIDDPDVWAHLSQTKIGHTAITPEVRFYLGKKGVFHGFYVAPFARFATYKASMPFEYDFEYESGDIYQSRSEIIPLSGKLTAITGGIQLGAQWRLSKQFFLDWWILGPQYGFSDGKIAGQKSLDEQEQAYLRDNLQETFADVPLVDTQVSVDGNGARVDFSGPWAGVRAGICLGFRF